MPPHTHTHTHRQCKSLIIFTPTLLKTRSLAALIWRHRGSKRSSTRVSRRLALQVQRIYHSEEADKSCSIFMAKENKMSTCPPKKTSCLCVHSSWEMNLKNPPILDLSRPGAHVYALQANGLTPVGNLFESLRCLSLWHVLKISLRKAVEDFWGWQVTTSGNMMAQLALVNMLAEPSGTMENSG